MSQEALDHDWHVEEREYRRQEERRGRRHAYETLDPSRTALVVVDLLPFFVTESPYCRGILPRVNTLARAVRESGGVVAWVVPASGVVSPIAESFLGPRVAALYADSGGSGPVRERLWSGLDTAAGDVYAEKSTHGAFYPGRSTLPAQLEARGIDTVVVAGTVTNVCCEATAREAYAEGYRVVFVADATAALRDQDHNATLHVVYRTFGDVRTTAEVVGLLAHASEQASQDAETGVR